MATDKAQYNKYVTEFQHILRFLSYSGYDITPIIPDGRFGEETRTAVKQLQCELGLEQTGTVDCATWNGGCERYKKELAKTQSCTGIYPFKNGQEVKKGDKGDIVIYIQILLSELSDIFTSCGCGKINGIFDENTFQAVKAFQKYSLIPQTGTVDFTTWNLLALRNSRDT